MVERDHGLSALKPMRRFGGSGGDARSGCSFVQMVRRAQAATPEAGVLPFTHWSRFSAI
jgi:hypothetical protein